MILTAQQSVRSLTEHSVNEPKNCFDDVYDLGKELNSGAFGVVHECYNAKNPEKLFAVKVATPSDDKGRSKIMYEVDMLRRLKDVANVIQLVDFYVDEDGMYIVQTLAKGGDVLERILIKETYNERDAVQLCYNLISTVKYVHEKKVVHRDIKPENLLLKSSANDTDIYLCDFGESKILPDDGWLSTFSGTLEYTAPEIILGYEYGQEVDMWSTGCIVFLLLSGYLPFGDQEDAKELVERSSQGDYDFDEACWDDVSTDAKRLIFNLLKVDPEARWTASQALKCRWLRKAERTNSSLPQMQQLGSKRMNLAMLKYIKNMNDLHHKEGLDFSVLDVEKEALEELKRNAGMWRSNDLFSKPFKKKFTKKRFMEEDEEPEGTESHHS